MSSTSNIAYITRFTLPVLIGLIGAILSAFIGWMVERAQQTAENRRMQIQQSIDICKKVIDGLDRLYAIMNNDAWYIAWRKRCSAAAASSSSSEHVDYPASLVERDKDKWSKYNECLDEWRSHEIGYETELKGSFGNRGYEAYLFLDADVTIEKAASMIWDIYYGNEGGVAPTWSPDGKASIREKVLDFSKEGQLRSMNEYFALMDHLRDRIGTLSSTMIHCIQIQSVGNMAEAPVPIPEKEREEAEALLNGQVTRRFQTSTRRSVTPRFRFKLLKASLAGSFDREAEYANREVLYDV